MIPLELETTFFFQIVNRQFKKDYGTETLTEYLNKLFKMDELYEFYEMYTKFDRSTKNKK